MPYGEPIASNISDAINHIKQQIEQQGAVIDATPFLKRFKSLPPSCITLFLLFITPLTIAFLVGCFFGFLYGFSAAFATFCISGALTFSFVIHTCLNFLSIIRSQKELFVVLTDLDKLFQYDNNMTVGFQLDNKNAFDITVVKAMIKKRKSELCQRAYTHICL